MSDEAVKPNQNTQLALFAAGGILTEEMANVFNPKAIESKGKTVGYSLRMQKRKEMAANLGLTTGRGDRARLDAAVLKQQDNMWRVIRAELNELDGNWTLQKADNKKLANGQRQISVVLREVAERGSKLDPAQIARALGMTTEEVTGLMDAEKAREQEARTTTVQA